MPFIEDTLVLKDGFSGTLDRYADKLGNVPLQYRNVEAEIEAMMDAEARKAKESANAEMVARMDLMRVEQQAQALRDYAARQAEEEARAEQEAAEAARLSAENHERLVNVIKQLGRVLISPIRALPRLAQGLHNVIQKIAGVQSPMDNFIKRIRMTAMGLFTARRMITYIKNALARAPADMAGGIESMTNMIKDGFDRAVLSLVRGFLPAMERLKTVMQSSGGQNLLKVFSQGMELLGRAVGFVIDKISELVTWAGEHLNQVLIAGSILLGLFAVKMAAVAVNTMIANAGLLLVIGVVLAMAQAMDATGNTFESVIGKIASWFGYLYAFIYNIVADIWNNALAPFGEAFATLLNKPSEAIRATLVALGEFALGVLSKIAGAIDALFGSNLSSAVNGWAANLEAKAADLTYHNTVARMEKLDPKATSQKWGEKASAVSDMFNPAKLGQYQLTELQDINKNTGATAKKVDMAAEDLKAFVDMAEREYVMRVNMQTVTPTITVNGQNTGNSREDAEALANRLADVLADLRSSSPSVPVDYVYTGGIG